MLRRLLTYSPGLLVVATLTNVLFNAVPILQGLAQRAVFDGLEQHVGLPTVALALIGYAGALVSVRILGVVWFWFHNTVEPRYEGLMRTNLVEWVLTQRGRRRQPASSAETVGHVRDDVPGYSDIVNESYRILGELTFLVVALTIMIRIDPVVTVATLAPIGAVILATHLLRSRLPALVARARSSTAHANALLTSLYSGITTIRTFGAEADVTRRYGHAIDERGRAAVRQEALEHWIDSVTAATVHASKALVLIFAASRILTGEFTVGDFVLFATYLDWMLDFPRRLGRLLSQAGTTSKSKDRLHALLSPTPVATLTAHRPLQPRIETRPAAPPPSSSAAATARLRVTDLSYRPFGQEEPVFTGVNLVLMPGELTVLTGRAGAGKSTLLRVISGDLAPSTGVIALDATVAGREEVLGSQSTVHLPQKPFMFAESIATNVQLDDANAGRLQKALADSQLNEDVAVMPRGALTEVGMSGARLSGGQHRRVALARCLHSQPTLLLLDDPTASLDRETSRGVTAALLAACTAGASMLIVTHDEHLMAVANQVLVMHNRTVAESNTAG